MYVGLTDGMRNGLLEYIATQLEGGVLEFRTGTRPATGNLAATGTVVGTLEFAATGFDPAAAGSMAKSTDTWEDPAADAAGTITWARFRTDADANGADAAAKRLDFDVTITGGGGAIEVENPVLEVGQRIVVTSLTLTMPQSYAP